MEGNAVNARMMYYIVQVKNKLVQLRIIVVNELPCIAFQYKDLCYL